LVCNPQHLQEPLAAHNVDAGIAGHSRTLSGAAGVHEEALSFVAQA